MVNRSKRNIEITAVKKDNLFGIVRRLYKRFIRIRGNPREIALGFALGVFVGMSPTMGVQTPIAIFLAALCKWSKLSAAIGVWISNPLTAPVLYGVTYITGAKLLKLEPVFRMPLSPTWSTLKAMLSKAPQALGAMTVGGAIIGLPLAIIGYYLSYAAVEKYQKDVKAKLARRKAKLADTKEKVKKMVRERKIAKAAGGAQMTDDGKQRTDDRGQKTEDPSSLNGFAAAGRGQTLVRKAEVGMRKSESKCKGQRTDAGEQMTDDRTQRTDDRGRRA